EMLDQLRGQEHPRTSRVMEDLRDLAAQTPELAPVANRANELLQREMRDAQQAFNQAGREKEVPKLGEQLKKAEKELDSAYRKIDELERQNQKIAQERLDQARLEQLADRQQELAKKSEELAQKDPVRN